MNSREAIHQSKTDEWYTPPQYIEAARAVMGSIDLDPASDPTGQQIVKAETFYTKAQDGLAQPWAGNVWLNPPYGKIGNVSNQALWSQAMIYHYTEGHIEQGIMLVNAVPGNKWFRELWGWPICFTDHRIKFLSPDGEPQKSPTHSNVFVYLGRHVGRFARHFEDFGPIVKRIAAVQLQPPLL